MTERVHYDEFSMFHENAREYGLGYASAPVVRRVSVDVGGGRVLSALTWGEGPPEMVLIHGGGQNAHTWDTVALALDRPLVAIDLPGHGHSDQALDPGCPSPHAYAIDVARAVESLAPVAKVIVGMSLGGLTTVALGALAPSLVPKMVLVDITPGVTSGKAQAIAAFVNGPATFPSFDQLLARTIEHNPGRTVESLRRGILHNALQLEDGSWMWRYRRFGSTAPVGGAHEGGETNHAPLWDALESFSGPVVLARGMKAQSVVDDADVAELKRRRPDAEVVEFPQAGHSIQGDSPVELATLIGSLANGERRFPTNPIKM